MSGDYSRRRFAPGHDFSAVLNQQGRVQLDSDWNEFAEILDRRSRAETVDIIGEGIVPIETPTGFQILTPANPPAGASHLTIGRGRIYVDGLLAENHGSGIQEFDQVLAETRGTLPIDYEKQPFLPNAAQVASLPSGGPYLVYIDVWQREITFLQNPDLVENAVGVETTTRIQTAWQVKLLKREQPKATTCSSDIQAWKDLIAPSAGRLSTKAVGVPGNIDSCHVPPSGGYRGLENRLYRLEIHDGGSPGVATFKWSRDNGSVATSVTGISPDLLHLTVASIGRDSVMRFRNNDWIEITDDWLEFASQPGITPPTIIPVPGFMAKIVEVVEASRTITLDRPLPATVFTDSTGNIYPDRHPRIRRWDQSGQVRDTNGNLLADLNEAKSPGVIPVPQPGTSIVLEDGVQITFDLDQKNGKYYLGDYWNFVARTADASVEALQNDPPKGIHHHFCRLALVMFDNTLPADCRLFWPPAYSGGSCECTICVSADEFKTNGNLLQEAIDRLTAKGGGKLCLGPGTFELAKTLSFNSRNASIHVSGRGPSTLLIQPPDQSAFQITGGIGNVDSPADSIIVEDLQVLTQPSRSAPDKNPAFAITNIFEIVIQRCRIVPVTSEAGASLTDPAIQLSGLILNATIRDNYIVAKVGVMLGVLLEDKTGRRLLTHSLRIVNNTITTNYLGIVFNQVVIFADTRLSGNTIFATSDEASAGAIEGDVPIGGIYFRQIFNLNAAGLNIDSNYLYVDGSITPSGFNLAAFGIGIDNIGLIKEGGSLVGTTHVVNNNIVVLSGQNPGAGIYLNHIVSVKLVTIAGNIVFGVIDGTSNFGWKGVSITSGSDPIGQQCYSIDGNHITANAPNQYKAVIVRVNGDCEFSSNQCVNDNSANNQDSDVEIIADVIIAGNNRVKGNTNEAQISMALTASTNPNKAGNATVLGNICSSGITLNGSTNLPSPWDLLNIKA